MKILTKVLLSFFVLTICWAGGYPSLDQFFIDTLEKKFSSSVTDIKLSAVEGTESFISNVKKRNVGEDNPQIYSVTFSRDNHHYECLGAVINDSERLTVSSIPLAYQDRAGFVYLDECVDINSNSSLPAMEYYVVMPLNSTLPLISSNLAQSYALYKGYITTKPKLVCIESDVNSNQDPRTSTTIHEIENYTLFATYFDTSSPTREYEDRVEYSYDRANFFGDIDRSSLPEVEETLDFLIDNLKGRMFIAFESNNCVKKQVDEMIVVSCFMEIENQASSLKNHEGSSLREVYANLDSRKVERLIIGIGGNHEIINEVEYTLRYSFIFGENSTKKIYNISTHYEKSAIGGIDECKIEGRL